MRTVAVGAVGKLTLETADVMVEVEGLSSELRVLVQPDRESALLGTDFPPFPKILLRKLNDILVQEESEGRKEPLPVQAVSIRSLCRQREEQQQADDADTAASGVMPQNWVKGLYNRLAVPGKKDCNK